MKVSIKTKGVFMKKLLAIDMDGTLLNWRKQISKRSINTLLRVQEDGNIVVLASGRSYERLIKYANKIKLKEYGGYMATLNGSTIFNVKTGEILRNSAFDYEVLKELFHFLDELNVDYSIYKKDTIYEGENSKFLYRIYRKLTRKSLKHVNYIFTENVEVNKVIINEKKSKLEEIQRNILAKFNDRVEVSITSFLSIEITAKNGSKGFAILDIAERLGIDKENIWSFGNHGNDISMFKISGRSIAVKNSVDKLKALATDITDSNNNDGVAKYLEENLLHLDKGKQ